jgi:hypothetical protein
MSRHPFSKSFLLSVIVLVVLVMAGLALPVATFAFPSQVGVGQMTSSLNPSHFGQAVTFTVCASTKPAAPLSNAGFFDGSTSMGLGISNGQGCFSLTTSALSIGTHHIAFGNPNDPNATLDQIVLGPADVPEGDSLVLLGGGLGGLSMWLRWQWRKRRQN